MQRCLQYLLTRWSILMPTVTDNNRLLINEETVRKKIDNGPRITMDEKRALCILYNTMAARDEATIQNENGTDRCEGYIWMKNSLRHRDSGMGSKHESSVCTEDQIRRERANCERAKHRVLYSSAKRPFTCNQHPNW